MTIERGHDSSKMSSIDSVDLLDLKNKDGNGRCVEKSLVLVCVMKKPIITFSQLLVLHA